MPTELLACRTALTLLRCTLAMGARNLRTRWSSLTPPATTPPASYPALHLMIRNWTLFPIHALYIRASVPVPVVHFSCTCTCHPCVSPPVLHLLHRTALDKRPPPLPFHRPPLSLVCCRFYPPSFTSARCRKCSTTYSTTSTDVNVTPLPCLACIRALTRKILYLRLQDPAGGKNKKGAPAVR